MGGAGRFPSMMAVNNFRPDIDFAVSVGTTPYRLAWSSFLIGSPARPPMPGFIPGPVTCRGETPGLAPDGISEQCCPQRTHDSVKRLHDRSKEVFIIDRVRSSWFWARAPNHRHNILSRVYVDGLPEDATSQECTSMNRIGESIRNPPHVPVVDPLAADHLAASGFRDPTLRKNLIVSYLTAIHKEQSKS